MEFKNEYADLETNFLVLAKMYRGNGFYKKAEKAEIMANYCRPYSKVYHGIPGFFSQLHDLLIYLIGGDERYEQLDRIYNRMMMDCIDKTKNILLIAKKSPSLAVRLFRRK